MGTGRLPTGTLTFLFTDIEGSTRLWEQHPSAAAQALIRHDELIETLVAEHGGQVVRPRGEGDSRFAVFPRASDALRAAAAIQRALVSEAWPTPEPLRVRMALHTGEADLRAGDYYGAAVNRCARLRALAHGGQVLVTGLTAALGRADLPSDLDLRDLGQHRLKDVAEPERVYELVGGWVPAFPPLRSTEQPPTNLPPRSAPLVGRREEVATLAQQLRRPDLRLLTLTGPGGIGKTRLAIEVASQVLDAFTDGVFAVLLAPLRDPELVLPTIADTLGVREEAGRPLLATLTSALRDKQQLLVLDNFEQVLAAAGLVAELLAACPQVKVLATSRAVLRLQDEWDHPVPPLGLPCPPLPPPERLTQFEAVQLFIERARAVRPDFTVTNANAPAVAEICIRLDGLPLAIELAAARSRLLPPQALLVRLEQRLPLLVGGARDLPARHQTLHAAIAWSHDLLEPAERVLFRRLAVFVGGATLSAIEGVCTAPGESAVDILEGAQSLVDKSLLTQVEVDGEPRLGMLETIRDFGLEQLEAAGELETLQQRHVAYYVALAEQVEPMLRLRPRERATWLSTLEREHANLLAALGRSHATPSQRELGLRLVRALGWFWYLRGHFGDARRAMERLLAAADADPAIQAGAMIVAGNLARVQGDYPGAASLLEQSLDLCRTQADAAGMAWSLLWLSRTTEHQGDYLQAQRHAEEALGLFREVQDRLGEMSVLFTLGSVALQQGEADRAIALTNESLALSRAMGDAWVTAWNLGTLALVAQARGDDARAEGLLNEALCLRRDMGDKRGLADSYAALARITEERRAYAEAVVHLRQSLALSWELGNRPAIAKTLADLARIASQTGERERSALLAGAAAALHPVPGPPAEAAVDDAAWQRGHSLPLHDAVAYALQPGV